jgi:hypothetical protein
MKDKNRLLSGSRTGLAAAVVFALCAVIAAQGPVTGAIFTTNADGTFVNGNVYDDAQDPYINGGPRANAKSCTAPGLPNGDYYFQVTDPSGSTLLSSDDIENRRVTVSGGLISAYGGNHSTGSGRCGDVTVRLFPFSATPNEGGEYKVWMTPVASYSAGSGAFGFLPQSSKTDNFKVTPAAQDTDGDGIPDVDDKCPTLYDPTNVCYTPR